MRNIQVNNEERKYKTYADSRLAAAKLYNDSYSKETVSLELGEKFNTSKVELMDWMFVTTCHSCEKNNHSLQKDRILINLKEYLITKHLRLAI